ncbi:MAG: tRNA lysidine(34) synthetase TilS [Thiobacillaceae bacterium]
MRHPLIAVRQALAGRIPMRARLCVGLSGGLDSTVLLHLLHRLQPELSFSLSAVHVHHGLSAQADAWAASCDAFCTRLGVPLQVERVRVAVRGQGIESAARQARYRVYAGLATDYVVLAHQQDDQVETVLLNLLRGSGVQGLAAMPIERPLAGSGVRLLRPLLEVSRQQIEAYARAQGLAWVEDESNLDTRHARNHLRHRVLPEIERRFPAYRGSLTRAARHLAECAELMAALAASDAAAAVTARGLSLARLAGLSRPRAKNLLRWYLAQEGFGHWPERRTEALLDQLLHAGSDKRIEFHQGGDSLRVWRGWLQRVPGRHEAPAEFTTWRGESRLAFAGGWLTFAPARGAGVSLARLRAVPVTVRPRQGGERLQPDCHRPRRSLKHLFQAHAIPPWERARLPLLYAGDALAWVAGLGVDCAFQARPDEDGLVIAWQPEGR